MPTEVLQNIVLNDDESLKGLYSSRTSVFPMVLGPGETLDLNAHFNYVPIGALRRYTGVKRLFLELDADGPVSVTVDIPGMDIAPYTIDYNGTPLDLGFPERDLLGISVTAGDGGCTIRSGRFLAESDTVNDVHLALCICTYHNDGLVKEKITSILGSDIWGSLRDHVTIIVVDNGRTLSGLPDGVRLIPSENHGGSGGFARGMLEAMDLKCTHVILNDDDAMFDPEVLFRTLTFYTFAGKEVCLGGSFLYKDRPTVVYESGAEFSEFKTRPHCCGLDLLNVDSNLFLSSDRESDFFGWWYCAFPMVSVSRMGLPLPFFFKFDDIEYGRRSDIPRTVLCGVSVWHPDFDTKYSVTTEYYVFRNLLIAGMIHNSPSREDVKKLFTRIEIDIVGYRYREAVVKMRAAEDVMKGPDHVFPSSLDGPLEDVDDYMLGDADFLRKVLDIVPDAKRAPHGLRHVLMNGNFLPSVGDRELSFRELDTASFYRVGRVLYTLDNGRGVICERSFSETVKLMVRLSRLRRRFLRMFDGLSEEYREFLPRYSSEGFWKEVYRD